MERAEEAVKENEEETCQSRGSSSIYTSSGSCVSRQADAIFSVHMVESEDLDDVFLPSDEEVENVVFTAESTRSLDAVEAASKEQSKWRRHPGSIQYLAGRDIEGFYQKTHHYSRLKMKQVGQSMKKLFFQIQEAITLIDRFREFREANAPNNQENHKQLWLEWSKKQFRRNEHLESARPEQIETRALADVCHIIQLLKDLCCDLMPDLHSVPSDIQEQFHGIKTHIEDIHASFSDATSFQYLSRNVLSRVQREQLKQRSVWMSYWST